MDQTETTLGIDNLVKRTADIAELTLTSSNLNQRHVEYLAYPDSKFNEELDECCQDNQRPLEEIYFRRNKAFVTGLPVEVIKLEAERRYNPVKEFLNPYLYHITIRHGPSFEWKIEKRYKHFHDLHKSLVDYVEKDTGRSISSLNKCYLSEGKVNDDEQNALIKKQEDQPCFPTHSDRIAFIGHSSIEDRCKMLQNYLNKVLKHPKFREHIAVREFLEVSPLSFVHGLGMSIKEGASSKRSNDDFRGRSLFVRVPFMCDKCKFHHGQKWFVIKDSYVVYMSPNSAVIGFPMLIDRAFSPDQGFRKTGTNNGIRIKNLQRVMVMKFDKEDDRDTWFDYLNNIKNNSLFTQQHPFNSFAPKRQDQYAQWFINGQSYMEAVSKAILAAREEIFITDWWLSPEILLVRPSDDESMRLDNLLGKRAEEGIRIYVMVFKDIVQVVGLNSWHTKVKLMSKSPIKKNIKVIRHPDHRVMPGTESSFLYSHHEKTLVIDQKIAFIGGIDLCWGRWDTDQHRLIDLGEENVMELILPDQINEEDGQQQQPVRDEAATKTVEKMAENANSVIPGSSNVLPKPLIDPTKKSEAEKNEISLKQTKNQNQKVTDLQSELTNEEKKLLAEEEDEVEHQPQQFKKTIRKIFKKNRKHSDDESSDEEEQMDEEEPADEKPQTVIGVTPVVDKKTRFFLGKDYSNSYTKDFEFIEKYNEDYIDRKLAPRMPWHDEALVVTGQAARDCARHFIQRWNIHKADKFRYNDLYPYILPKSSNDEETVDIETLNSILGEERKAIRVDAQCVRSISFWSCGTRTFEHSIQNAYIHMIDSAQHFIYIENQFFITIAEDATIKNHIGDALYRRIIRANINKEKFRVYVVLPLIPGFSNVNSVQAVLYFIMRSINKGDTSLYQRLKTAGVTNPEDYITFYGMRNWDILMGTLVTEVIYVHSKLMIVDDRMCICGSANINDRSLLGTRDSEFCLVVNDTQMIDSQLNGQIQKVGTFCSTWRKKLFRQILGVENNEQINVDDPCTDEFYEYFRKIAQNNAKIYEDLFNTIPTNKIRNFGQVEEYMATPKTKDLEPKSSHEKCKEIQGFIVEFPLDFLADDVLMPKINTAEGMAPILLWT